MVSPSNLNDDPEFENMGIDLDQVKQEEDAAFKDMGFDIEEDYAKSKESPSWRDVASDFITQGARGIAKRFTWPADVLRVMVIGEGLSDIDDLERVYQREGKSFDREKYINAVLDAAQFVPTQESIEKAYEKRSGESLEPKTGAGKGIKQIAEIFSFGKGGLAQRTTGAALGVGTTQILKDLGAPEGVAEFTGDVIGLSPGALEKTPRQLSKEAASYEQKAQKHALPFLEMMAQENAPVLRGKLFETTERTLKDQFNLSSEKAIREIVKGELPIKRLQERGINLDALGQHAYEQTTKLARMKPQPLTTTQIVRNIDSEISRIKSLAPSPSDSQKAAMQILENERDILKVSNPTPEQLINQHMNYNADMKNIYRKSEFSGKEEQVRKAYEFLKNQLVETIDKQGSPATANAFRAANKIYHEKSKLDQTENLLRKVFDQGYNPKKLDKLLKSKQGNFLKRNMSPKAIEELHEIADYGKMADEKMTKFLELRSPSVINEVKGWGELAPFLLLPENLKGMGFVNYIRQYVKGKLLIRPATREAYKLTMKHAAEGSFNLIKKDFMKLESLINQEYGDLDNFFNSQFSELEFYNGE